VQANPVPTGAEESLLPHRVTRVNTHAEQQIGFFSVPVLWLIQSSICSIVESSLYYTLRSTMMIPLHMVCVGFRVFDTQLMLKTKQYIPVSPSLWMKLSTEYCLMSDRSVNSFHLQNQSTRWSGSEGSQRSDHNSILFSVSTFEEVVCRELSGSAVFVLQGRLGYFYFIVKVTFQLNGNLLR